VRALGTDWWYPCAVNTDEPPRPAPAPTRQVATVRLREDGVVEVRVYPGVRQTAADASANFAAAIAVRAARRRPILVDISGAEPLDPEVRRCYTGDLLSASFTALALVVEASSFGRMTGNIYLRIARPAIPTRLFSNALDATAWLRSFLV